MQPEDIIVGKRYINKRHPGWVWLGCGERVGMFSEPHHLFKRLVIVDGDQEVKDYWVGVFAKQPQDGVDPRYWDAFELEEKAE